jgi:hypothetical protein
MSRNHALEKVGRAKLAYKLLSLGWKTGEAFDDGYDVLAYHPERHVACYIELKSMDIANRGPGTNLTAPVSVFEQRSCTHIVVYVEPGGWFFVARKDKILTPAGNIFAALNQKRELRTPKKDSRSFAPYRDAWHELLE